MASPVDFISGPNKTSTSGNLLKGNTASLTAKVFLFFFLRLNLDNFSPAITLEAIFATESPVAFDTNGTVLLALGLTSRT